MAEIFLSAWETLRENVRLADILDIGVISLLLYFALGWLRQRASRSAAIALALMVLLYLLARALHMYLTTLLFQAGFVAVVLAFIVIFQEDLRRGFERVATWSIFSGRPEEVTQSSTIDLVVESIVALAQQRIGSLVVLKGLEPLHRHIRGGVDVGGRISLPLLYSIFHPESPGHDGAVLIERDRIEKIGVHLPLSKNLAEVGTAGTRHAAALGVAERSDALVIVVSEERGTVSIAQGGRLEQVRSPAELKRRLEEFTEHLGAATSTQLYWRGLLLRDLPMKTSAVLLAILLWLLLASRFENVQRVVLASVQYRNLPRGWMLGDSKVTTAQLTLSGSERLFEMLDSEELIVSVDLARVSEGQQEILLSEENVNLPPGLNVARIEPQVIRVTAFPMVRTELPVTADLWGELPDGLQLEQVQVRPGALPVLMRRSLSRQITTLRTEPIDLRRIDQTTTRHVNLVLPSDIQLVEGARPSVQVTIHVKAAEPQPETTN